MRKFPYYITNPDNNQKQPTKQQKHPKIELNRTRSYVNGHERIHPKKNKPYTYPYQRKKCQYFD